MAAKASIRVLLRDNNSDLVAAWKDPQAFGADKYKEDVQVSRHIICQGYSDVEWLCLLQISYGDIFEGAPSADAIVRAIIAVAVKELVT